VSEGDARLGKGHSQVKRLRELLRDAKTRRSERAFVVEGPRAIHAALDHHAALDAAYFGPGATRAFAALRDRLVGAGVETFELKEGVLERVGSTVTPQPVLAVAASTRYSLDDLARGGLVVVAVDVTDPGNAGTILRSAEAAGVVGVVFCGNSVDLFNPKVVRASAGAIFGVPVVEGDDPVMVLDELGAQGRTRFGTRASHGTAFETVDLTAPVAVVFGNEAHGLPDALPLDGFLTIPMTGGVESINVAMAATVVCFEAARQRRTRGPGTAP